MADGGFKQEVAQGSRSKNPGTLLEATNVDAALVVIVAAIIDGGRWVQAKVAQGSRSKNPGTLLEAANLIPSRGRAK